MILEHNRRDVITSGCASNISYDDRSCQHSNMMSHVLFSVMSGCTTITLGLNSTRTNVDCKLVLCGFVYPGVELQSGTPCLGKYYRQ